jgi:hypothetical protein
MSRVKRVADHDTVLIWIGWDQDGHLRVIEDSEWETDFMWRGEARLICVHVPVSARPKQRKPLHLYLDLVKLEKEALILDKVPGEID